MQLMRKSSNGTIYARYNRQGDNCPGIDISKKGKDGMLSRIATVETDETTKQTYVIVYADINIDEPTHVIPINF